MENSLGTFLTFFGWTISSIIVGILVYSIWKMWAWSRYQRENTKFGGGVIMRLAHVGDRLDHLVIQGVDCVLIGDPDEHALLRVLKVGDEVKVTYVTMGYRPALILSIESSTLGIKQPKEQDVQPSKRPSMAR